MGRQIESEVTSIGTFLKIIKELNVPIFQRNYDWSDEEVDQLWQDIIETIDIENRSEHFMGSIVLKNIDEKSFEIIDGQQRITTVYGMISVIRRILNENNESKRADILDEYFGKTDFATLETKSKFRMNQINNKYFQDYYASNVDDAKIDEELKKIDQRNDSNALLLKALKRLRQHVLSRQKDYSGKEFDLNTILQIVEFLDSKLQILTIKVHDEADAYMIFETLNDRGKDLTTLDLLKNHIFSKSGEPNRDTVIDLWSTIRDNLLSIPIDRFLLHYWTSKYGRTSRTRLFNLMRSEITNPKSAIAFAKSLDDAAKLYNALGNPSSAYWEDYDQTTRDNLETLGLLDSQQAYPILMAAKDKFDKDEFSKLTHTLVVMAIRYNFIGELRTGVLANYYSEIPKDIQEGKFSKNAHVFRKLKAIYPSDSEFKISFIQKIVKEPRKARYILSAIESYMSEKSTEVSKNTINVNLEHILPRNASGDWSDTVASFDDKIEMLKYIYKLGNLAIMASKGNKGIGSKGFQIKSSIYLESEFETTKKIADYELWSKQAIDKRQEWLADYALKIWRVDIE